MSARHTPDAGDESGDGPGAVAEAGTEAGIPRWWRSQPLGLWWALPIGLTISVWVLLEGRVRLFGYLVAGTLVVAAGLRAVLPRDTVGGLMVRSRLWDVVTLVVLAAAVTGLAATLNLPG